MFNDDDDYDRNVTRWEAYDGRQILIKDLEVRHLVNILNWIKKTNKEHGRAVYTDGLLHLMEAEADLRVMLGWAKNKGIPRKDADGWWEVINQTRIEKAIEDAKTLFHRWGVKKKKKLKSLKSIAYSTGKKV